MPDGVSADRLLFDGSQHFAAPRRHSGVIEINRGASGLSEEDLEALYRRLRLPLVRLANLVVGSEDVAEDVVQEAFYGYSRNAAHVTNPDGYLRRAVVNGARSHHRRASRATQRNEVVTVTGVAEMDETWGLLRRLPVRQRAALVLRYYEDLPFDEVARLMGCRPSTARSLARRGLARMKELLG